MIVLVVEDNPQNGWSMAEQIRAAGHRAEWAADGRSARIKLGVMRPDAVLLDLLLPDMDGLELLRTLPAGTRPVVLTGLGGEDLEAVRREFPGVAVLKKPQDVPDILAALEGRT